MSELKDVLHEELSTVNDGSANKEKQSNTQDKSSSDVEQSSSANI